MEDICNNTKHFPQIVVKKIMNFGVLLLSYNFLSRIQFEGSMFCRLYASKVKRFHCNLAVYNVRPLKMK